MTQLNFNVWPFNFLKLLTLLSLSDFEYSSLINPIFVCIFAGVYFDNRVENVKFIDFCGKYRVPFMQYLCSSKWVTHLYIFQALDFHFKFICAFADVLIMQMLIHNSQVPVVSWWGKFSWVKFFCWVYSKLESEVMQDEDENSLLYISMFYAKSSK